MADPIRPTDDAARGLARDILAKVRHAALGVNDPQTDLPLVSRIAVLRGPDNLPLGLASDLSRHSQALQADPRYSLLLGDPGDRGDPLTHPRLTLQGRTRFVRHGDPDHAALTAYFVTAQPKARLYIGFADFALLRFSVERGFLNGGFGKAYLLTIDDLTNGIETGRLDPKPAPGD